MLSSIDDNIKWSPHCTKIVKRAHHLLSMISKSFVSRDPAILLKIYRAYVLPILDYLSPIWCPFLVRDIESVEKVQKRFTRLFPRLRKLSYRQRLSSLGLLSLQTRRLRFDLVTLYKILHGLIDVPLDLFFTPCPSLHRTRGHPYKLFVNNSRLNSRKHFFSQRIVPFWNGLPTSVVTAGRVSQFRVSLDRYLADNNIW